MNDLSTVMHYIRCAPVKLDCVVVDVKDWDSVRREFQEYCEEEEMPFKCDPKFPQPNFLVFGVPVVAGGNA